MYTKSCRLSLLVVLALNFSYILNADDLNIDNLLTNIEHKTDLSAKTKLENGGISYIYTRDDIQKMQAHTLNDLLKTTYPSGYSENRYGISDSFSLSSSAPFMSSKIKIYIDNQEITSGLYGSGLSIYGKMDIDFVDHIEVYAGNPTLELSTEAAFVVIRLFSKTAQKDEGSKITLEGGSYGSKGIKGYTTSTLDNDWSYFAYASAIDAQREKYDNYNATLSRDSRNGHVFATLAKDKQHILVDAITTDEDSFIAMSSFATPDTSTIKNNYLHIGYDSKIENYTFLLTFDEMATKTDFEDANVEEVKTLNAITGKDIPYSSHTDSTSEVYTAGIKYDFITSSNKLVIGMKYRLKHFKYTKMMINDIAVPSSGHSQQVTSNVFLENQYSISENKIFTSGVSFSRVTNNYSNQDDDLFAFRLGYTYTNEYLISKTILSHIETSIDPYLVNSGYILNSSEPVPTERQDIGMQNIKYEKETNSYELIVSYMLLYNKLLSTPPTGYLSAYEKRIDIGSTLLRYTRKYREYDKLELTTGMNIINNNSDSENVFEYATTIRNFNTFGNFDIFNEVLFYRDSNENKSYYDYSAGIIYHTTKDLSFSLKGTNILDKARESSYMRIDPTTYQVDTPLKISSIDRKVTLRVEYTF